MSENLYGGIYQGRVVVRGNLLMIIVAIATMIIVFSGHRVEASECCVCQELIISGSVASSLYRFSCIHGADYHLTCYAQWFARVPNCPICREAVACPLLENRRGSCLCRCESQDDVLLVFAGVGVAGIQALFFLIANGFI